MASPVLEILLLFKFDQNSPSDHGLLSMGGSKNGIGSKKFMQVEVDVKCTETNFGGLRNGKSVTSKPDNYHVHE